MAAADALPAPAAERRTQAQRREEAESRLLEAALAIVAATGTVRLTLAAVGEAAGYSRGLAAHRFGSKAGLLRALAAHITTRFADQLQAAPQRRSGLDAISGHIEVYFGRSDQQWTSTRALLVMMSEGFMDDAGFRDDMAAYNRQALRFFEVHLQAGIARGEIAVGVDAQANAVLLLGALRGVMLQWLLDRQIDLPRVRDAVLAVVEGLLAKDIPAGKPQRPGAVKHRASGRSHK